MCNMRSRITLALFFSLVLILGASWFRAGNEKVVVSVTSVDKPSGSDSYQFTPESTSDLSKTDVGTPDENLTTTDLVGRQLISEYMNLASAGQATEESITNLANKYADAIADIQTSPKVNALEINVVSNSKSNFQTYDLITTEIEKKRIKSINAIGINTKSIDASNTLLNETVLKISRAYETAAQELKKIAVPSALLTLHVSLINNYLSISSGAGSIPEGESDSALAFAQVVGAADAIKGSEQIVADIIKILLANGIQN